MKDVCILNQNITDEFKRLDDEQCQQEDAEVNEKHSEEKRILHDVIEMNQAKIDELQKLRSLDEMAINQLAQANQVWQIKCDGLKKKLDCCREENKALLMNIFTLYDF
jgi:chromosome segregation ATPase